MTTKLTFRFVDAIEQINATEWNTLAGIDYPFTRHEFLSSLEQTGCLSSATGWQPVHLIASCETQLVAAMPLYLKAHSRGEYVFDQAWARAYQQHGFAYYPKLVTAIPFTPCQGPRILIEASADKKSVIAGLLNEIKAFAEQHQLSSWHCLFPNPTQLSVLQDASLLIREDVQFQWLNQNYRDFDDFLANLTSVKRKMVKRERRKLAEQGIELFQLRGDELTEQQWQIFFQFYALTYLKKASNPYLNLKCFQTFANTLGAQMLVIFAKKNADYVGAALSFIGHDTLYGRYWGCYEEYNALHFEACYYQGIEYCIQHKLTRFDSGAQGEHKIARGFTPITTYSTHWLRDSIFHAAINDFLTREKLAVNAYKNDAAHYLPYKNKRETPH